MPTTYLDSSAIVKLAIRERESDALRRHLRRRRALISSALARTEVLGPSFPAVTWRSWLVDGRSCASTLSASLTACSTRPVRCCPPSSDHWMPSTWRRHSCWVRTSITSSPTTIGWARPPASSTSRQQHLLSAATRAERRPGVSVRGERCSATLRPSTLNERGTRTTTAPALDGGGRQGSCRC